MATGRDPRRERSRQRAIGGRHPVDDRGRGARRAGTRLLSPKGCEAIFEEQANGTDLVLGVPLRFGMGYGLSSELLPIGPRPAIGVATEDRSS